MAGILQKLFWLLIPFVLYFGFLTFMKKKRGEDGRLDPETDRKLFLLSAVGIVLLIGLVFFLGMTLEDG